MHRQRGRQHQYDRFKSSVTSEGTLFRIQGVVAIVVAVAVLIWPRVLSRVLSILVAGSAAVAVVLYTYVNVGALGPLPNLYENTCDRPAKVGSAVAETAATLVAIARSGADRTDAQALRPLIAPGRAARGLPPIDDPSDPRLPVEKWPAQAGSVRSMLARLLHTVLQPGQ
jgi:hypothetical protein